MCAENYDPIMVDRLIKENHTLRKENTEIKTKCASLEEKNASLEEKNAKLTKCVQSAVKAIRQIVPLLALLNENVVKTNAENALTKTVCRNSSSNAMKNGSCVRICLGIGRIVPLRAKIDTLLPVLLVLTVKFPTVLPGFSADKYR